MDIDGFLEVLNKRGYDGFVNVGFCLYKETPIEIAYKVMTCLEERGRA